MATTTATITLASTDLLSDELALTTTANLTTAGTSTGITQAAGLSRNTTTSTGAVTLFAASSYGDNKALLPWDGAGDFKYTPGQSDSTTVEFMMFHEGA